MSSEDLNALVMSSSDPDLRLVAGQIKNMQRFKKLLLSISKQSSLQEKLRSEQNNSQSFWSSNRKLQSEIDSCLVKLKELDSNSEKIAMEEYSICKEIDGIQQQIKQLLVSQVVDHVKKAQPLFNKKEEIHGLLQTRHQTRQDTKAQKILIIEKMMSLLERLKQHRLDRIRALTELTGVTDNVDFSTKLSFYTEASEQIERVYKSKQGLNKLDTQERHIEEFIGKISNEIQDLFNQLTMKQSEEAKAFNDLALNSKEKSRIFTLEKVLTSQVLPQLSTSQIKDLSKKLKDYREFLSSFSNEEAQIKQGLLRTQETLTVFRNILLAIRTEQERKSELLRHLELIAKLHSDQSAINEKKRQLQLQLERKKHLQKNYQEDLQSVVEEANLDAYKKVASEINNQQHQKSKIQGEVNRLNAKLSDLRKQVLSNMQIVKEDFDDILKEVMPSEWFSSHSIDREEDLRSLRTYLKKTLKRLGI